MSTIVVGVDGSEESKHAMRFALEEAKLRQAKLRIVHARRIPVGVIGAPLIWAPTPETEAKLREEQLEWLEGLVREVAGEAPGVEITWDVIEEEPVPALVEAARDAELLVLGSRGHGGFSGLLLGSVSQQCVHHALCAVVIVR
jgi:nucleotide-binding universal stress UspA family protein